MSKKITLKDIASKLNVSITAVSLALKNDPSISEDLTLKIHHQAREMGYKVKKRVQPYIAVLQPITKDTSHSWGLFSSFLEEIETLALKNSFYPIIFPVGNDVLEDSDLLFEKIQEFNICGVISIHYTDQQLFNNLLEHDIAITVVNNASLENQFSAVLVDDIDASFQACKKLIDANHKKILYLDYVREDLPQLLLDRRLGIEKTKLTHSHIELSFDRLKTISPSICMTILEKHQNITAIIAHDDYLAMNLISAMAKLNIVLGENLSLIAVGGVLSYLDLHCDAYEIDGTALGRLAISDILRQIQEQEGKVQTYKVPQIFVDRGSTKKL